MASQALTPPLPAPGQIAKALVGATPAELSKSPLLGIVAVVMGAGIVTLAGRLLSLGMADLKGSREGTTTGDLAIHQISAGLYPRSSGLPAAIGRATGVVGARVRLQAYTLSLIDGFLLVAWACVAALLLVATLRPSPLSFKEVGFQQEIPASPKDRS